ncbi:hypothetical protein RclHR1_18370003 [Rhizophagus clarus]|uniref:Uncharacterized protein n=1 Tax=Rhizophagus clarus TaxID=94130 RepID=A0A2Z6QLT2_9GLOM|nr:hypothetical protein RclHR1_18370003 [Rhizophagus clarus]GES86532.1 hypothetical protein GLOIN_2v1886013 [Rhizophagus clarus]
MVSIRPLARLIENTNGKLTEITIHYTTYDRDDITYNDNNNIIIQNICKKCPILEYLKLPLIARYVLELEKLLINCQYLKGLHIIIMIDDIGNLFKILARSSPNSLFKFKFDLFYQEVEIESLKLFFDNWKGRHPMWLQFKYICMF